MISAVDLALQLLAGLLPQIRKSQLPQHIIADVQSAFDSLTRVHGSDVTQSQLESLRVPIPSWEQK